MVTLAERHSQGAVVTSSSVWEAGSQAGSASTVAKQKAALPFVTFSIVGAGFKSDKCIRAADAVTDRRNFIPVEMKSPWVKPVAMAGSTVRPVLKNAVVLRSGRTPPVTCSEWRWRVFLSGESASHPSRDPPAPRPRLGLCRLP